MKKGVHYWALPPAMALPQKLRFAAECGFQGVELLILDKGPVRLDSSAGELAEVRRQAEATGVEILSLSTPLSWRCSLTSENPAIREKAKATARAQLRIAGALGAGAALVLPGFVKLDFEVNALCTEKQDEAPYSPSQEVVPYDLAWDRACQGLRELAPAAEEAGVDLCVENIWNHFLLSPLEMRSLIDQAGSPRVRSYFDVGNVLEIGEPEQWIRILGSRIARVHFKDYRREAHAVTGFTELLHGDVDFGQVMAALRDIGYNGWLTAELNANPQCPEETARRASQAMDEILRR